MKLAEAAWPEVDGFSRDAVVLVPTGSLEQHGPHLPLLTDSILATAVAEAVESRLVDRVVLTPTVWLGASAHHLSYPGSLSASFAGYHETVLAIVRSLARHGFWKFYVVNGHGGNTEPNGVAMRSLKEEFPHAVLGHIGYFNFVSPDALATLRGPLKVIAHACEAETSLMLHVAPGLVRTDRLTDDGLQVEPPVPGVVAFFDEVSEKGPIGHATFARAETGQRLFESAVDGLTEAVSALAAGIGFRGISSVEPV
ncbi:MAG: creatininase family protein [Fimbriimonadaceae bacterium]|nr:creatininase family protein [Fimbriimonadaceae bacterium]